MSAVRSSMPSCRPPRPVRHQPPIGVVAIALGVLLATFVEHQRPRHRAARANGTPAAAGDGKRHVARAIRDGRHHARRGGESTAHRRRGRDGRRQLRERADAAQPSVARGQRPCRLRVLLQGHRAPAAETRRGGARCHSTRSRSASPPVISRSRPHSAKPRRPSRSAITPGPWASTRSSRPRGPSSTNRCSRSRPRRRVCSATGARRPRRCCGSTTSFP